MRMLLFTGILLASVASAYGPAVAQQRMSGREAPTTAHIGGVAHGSRDMHHHAGHRPRGSILVPFGYWDWQPYPDVVVGPQATGTEAVPPIPAPPTRTVELPPCRETTSEGVTVVRGMSCSRGGH